MITLAAHQQAALNAVLFDYQFEGVGRQIVQMATGAGKTVTAAALASTLLSGNTPLLAGRCLFLAHRDKLLLDAMKAFAHYFPLTQLGIVQGEQDYHTTKITFASVPTIKNPERLARMLRYGKFDLVIVDECHHATAASYRKLLGTIKEPTNPLMTSEALLVGLTATPLRSDNVSLRLIFERISFSVGILELITAEPDPWLVDLKGINVEIPDLKLSDITDEDEDGDFTQAQREQAILASMQSQSRYRGALDVLKKFPEIGKLQGIYFAASVADAYGFADFANSAGITTETLLGGTPPEERQRIYDEFNQGIIQYLSNMNVLTEGIDVPTAKVAIIGCHTRFVGRFIQMVGRITRIHPTDRDKPYRDWQYPIGYIVDLVDNDHTVVMISDMVGTTEEKAKGKTVREMAKEKVINPYPVPKSPVYQPGATLRVAASSVFTSRHWQPNGQDYQLTTPQGTYVAHHSFGGAYETLFYPKGTKGVKRLSKPVPLEQSMGFGEQHIQRVEYRNRTRNDEQLRSQFCSVGEVAKLSRVFRFIKPDARITKGRARDLWDQLNSVGGSIGAWYARYMPRKKKG